MTDTPIASSADHRGSDNQALYRRFRAQTFSQIVGQDAVVQTLRNGVRLDRVGHGFLFVGPRGTGKTSTARIMAKAVNCTDLRDGEPCDACANCVSIREGRALDVVELDAASNNKVDDMRELVPRVYTAASDLRRKVFIIDEVQRIKEGWDVLLKTLEEPPDGVLFIFCTTDPSQIRPAVVSRLQRFTFRPAVDPRDRGQAPAHPRDRRAHGRSRKPSHWSHAWPVAACAMPNRCSTRSSSASPTRSPPASIQELLGLADDAAVDRFISALVEGDVLAGVHVLDSLEAEGRDLVAFSEQLVERLRALLVERMSSKSADERAAARPLAQAARRLSGIDASRSGLGGYRWQLELCLLAAADGPIATTPAVSSPDVCGAREPSPTQPAAQPASTATSCASPPLPPRRADEPRQPARERRTGPDLALLRLSRRPRAVLPPMSPPAAVGDNLALPRAPAVLRPSRAIRSRGSAVPGRRSWPPSAATRPIGPWSRPAGR